MDKLKIISTIKLESSIGEQHANKQSFKGILCSVGSASVKAPIGSDGKQVVLTKAAAETAVDTLKGMPVNVVWNDPNGKFTGHDQTTIIGIVANAWVQDDDVWIEGYLFPQNYPEICASVRQEKDNLGFSYEILANSYEETNNKMMINEFTFIGTALLRKDKAAYGNDTQLIAAQITKEKDDDSMSKEELQVMIDAMFANVDKKLNEIKASIDEKVTAFEAKIEASSGQVENLATALAETKEAIKTSAKPVEDPVPVVASAEPVVVPAPTVLAVGQTVVDNDDLTKVNGDKEAKIKEINASTMSPSEKCKQITKIRLG